MHERLELEIRNGVADAANVGERVLAREHDALETERTRMTRAPLASWMVIWVEPWISKPGIDTLDEPHEPDVLHDGRVHSAIDRLAEEHERVGELARLEERVQREVDARAPRRARAGTLRRPHRA